MNRAFVALLLAAAACGNSNDPLPTSTMQPAPSQSPSPTPEPSPEASPRPEQPRIFVNTTRATSGQVEVTRRGHPDVYHVLLGAETAEGLFLLDFEVWNGNTHDHYAENGGQGLEVRALTIYSRPVVESRQVCLHNVGLFFGGLFPTTNGQMQANFSVRGDTSLDFATGCDTMQADFTFEAAIR